MQPDTDMNLLRLLGECTPAAVARVPRSEVSRIIALANAREPYDAPTPSDGGARQDWWTYATYLFGVASFIKTILDIYILLRDKLKRAPSAAEVREDERVKNAASGIRDSAQIVARVLEKIEG